MVTQAECHESQHECRREVFAAIGRKVGTSSFRWIIGGLVSGILILVAGAWTWARADISRVETRQDKMESSLTDKLDQILSELRNK